MCCLVIPLLVLGVFYIYKLTVLKADGLKYGMPPDVLEAWRGNKRMQYIWGIIAIFGSGAISIIGFFAYVVTYPSCTSSYNSYTYTYNSCDNLQTGGAVAILIVGWILAPLVVLVVGLVLSWMSSSKAKALEAQGTPVAYGMPGAYPPAMPGAYPPAGQGGWPQQPGAYPPPPPPPVDPQAPTGA
jgi:hypothetical protein